MCKLLVLAFWYIALAAASDETCNQDESACRPVPRTGPSMMQSGASQQAAMVEEDDASDRTAWVAADWVPRTGPSMMQSRASQQTAMAEEDDASDKTAWVAEDWGDCLVGCGEGALPLKFRIVKCRSVFSNHPVSDEDCDGPQPGNSQPCDCSEGCTKTVASDCPPLERKQAAPKQPKPVKLYEPVGCFEFARPAENKSAEDPLRPRDCETAEGDKPCMGGLPFFAKTIPHKDAGACMRFCLSMALDIAGIDGGNTCRCGTSLANQELFSHGPPRDSIVFRPDLLKRSSSCPLAVYRFKGPYEDHGVPDHFNGHMVQDLVYIDSIVVGYNVTEMQEEDGNPGNESADALVETGSSANTSLNLLRPSFNRNCWPGNCGPGRGPWKKRTRVPPAGAVDAWREHVVIKYTWKAGTDQARKNVFRAAVAAWKSKTCISLVYVDSLPYYGGKGITVGNYDGSMCWLTGMGDGRSKVNLGWCNNMRHLGSVIHEIGHALGLNHIQKRPDATSNYHGHGPFLRMYWQNIGSRWERQYTPDYQSYTGSADDGEGDPKKGYAEYDFGSIMHYNGGSSYDTYPAWKEQLVGQRKKLSKGDIEMVLDMYQCKPHVKTASLSVNVYSGEGLPNMDYFRSSDPYVKMSYSDSWGKQSKQTLHVGNNLNPVWNADLSFDYWNSGTSLCFDVFDYDSMSSSDHMGRACMTPQVISQFSGQRVKLPLDQGGQLIVSVMVKK